MSDSLWDYTPVYYLRKIWAIAKGLWKIVVACGGLLMVIGKMIWAFVDVQGGLESLAGHLDEVAASLESMPTHTIMAYVNRVFPLTELIGLLALYYSFCLAAIVVRWVRSFIPTMGG